MNIYEDYINYMNDCNELIEKLYATNSAVLTVIDDVINITDYIYQLNNNQEKIEDELAEIFEIGFGYLSNTLADLKVYYEEYFNKDIILFNSFASTIVLAIYIEDLRSHLLANDYLTPKRQEIIDKIAYELDSNLMNKKNNNNETLDKYNVLLEEIMPLEEEAQFKPVYTVFALIREELDRY